MTKFLILALSFIAITIFSAEANAQTAKKSANQKINAKILRDLYFKRDYQNCTDLGDAVNEKTPIAAQAWAISCQAKILAARENALQAAQNLSSRHDENAWSWFALANALTANQKNTDALAAAEKAESLEPNNEDFIFLKAQILSSLREYDQSGSYLERNSAKIKDQSRKFYMQAIALNSRSRVYVDKVDEPAKKQSFEYFAKAVELNPQSVNANFLYGFYLDLDTQHAEAFPYLKKAVELSPRSFEIRQTYWRNLEKQPDKTDEQRQAAISADIEDFLRAGNNSPETLVFVAQKFRTLKNKEKQDFYENQILQKYPNTKYDESVIYQRISDFEIDSTTKTDPAKLMEMLNKMAAGNAAGMMKDKEYLDYQKQLAETQNKLKSMRWDYVKRPQHFDEAKLGDVYFGLLRQIAFDRNVPDAQFDEVLQNVLKYKKDSSTNVHSEIARMLISAEYSHPQSVYKDEAVKFGRDGIVEADEKISELKKIGLSKETFDSRSAQLKSFAENALGAVLIAKKQYDEAEKVLLEAAALDSENPATYYSLGQVYLGKKDYDKAEEYYLKTATGKDSDKNRFRELYRNRNGSYDGFDEYFSGVKEKVQLRAREKVLNSKISNPKDAVPFSLKTIDDKTISLADLKGKIIVINFWGTWCAPCVMEMPQLQQLYKKYEHDENVAIITMDANDEIDVVKKFIADKKYEFPVLRGDSYTGNIMIDGGIAFPTTLFIDRNGKISFVKVSRTENLLDEFSWRIEALKSDK